jgi:hypothetical protein
MNEDQGRMRLGNDLHEPVVLRRMTLNAAQNEGIKRHAARKNLSSEWDDVFLASFLGRF